MTAHLQQHVVPRLRQPACRTGRGSGGQARGRRFRSHHYQRGNVSEATLTVGFAVVALVTAVVLGFLYLQQVFSTAAHGSNIQALEQTMMQLKEKQKELELEGASLRSIQSVEKRVEELNLVSANSVGYLAPRPARVAWQTRPLY